MSKQVYVCPACASPSMEISSLAGGLATCKACGWSGSNADVPVARFETSPDLGGVTVEQFISEFMQVYVACAAKPIGAFLLKWGFIQPDRLGELRTYMESICRASAKAVLETRQRLEHDRVKKEKTKSVC